MYVSIKLFWNKRLFHIVVGSGSITCLQVLRRGESGGKQKMLTAREAKILELLAVNKNEVVRREAVLSRFWGVEDKDYFASRSLDVFIKKIRTALEDEPGVELKTIRGVGFKLIAE